MEDQITILKALGFSDELIQQISMAEDYNAQVPDQQIDSQFESVTLASNDVAELFIDKSDKPFNYFING